MIGEVTWADGVPSMYCGWCSIVHELIRTDDGWTCAEGAAIDAVIRTDLERAYNWADMSVGSVGTTPTDGGTAGSAALYCGRCSSHDFLDSAGEWGGEDHRGCTLGELRAAITAHAPVCLGAAE